MALQEKEFIAGILSKTLNMDEAGVASLYNEDGTIKDEAITNVLNLDVERISKVKPDLSKVETEFYKKGTRETMEKFEKELSEKFGVKSGKKGIELIGDIISEQIKSAGAEVNEDTIKKHPLYISTVDKLSKEKDEAVKAESEKFVKFQTELQKKETFNVVGQKAKELFLNLKPVLSQDKNKADAQVSDFIEKLKAYEYDPQGDSIIVLKDGKVYEDQHSHRIPFEKVVKEIAEKYFDFHAVDQKKSPSNDDGKNKGEKVALIEPPKNVNDYTKTIADSSIPVKDRMEFKAKYEKQFLQTN